MILSDWNCRTAKFPDVPCHCKDRSSTVAVTPRAAVFKLKSVCPTDMLTGGVPVTQSFSNHPFFLIELRSSLISKVQSTRLQGSTQYSVGRCRGLSRCPSIEVELMTDVVLGKQINQTQQRITSWSSSISTPYILFLEGIAYTKIYQATSNKPIFTTYFTGKNDRDYPKH